jgi:hypothetical protein
VRPEIDTLAMISLVAARTLFDAMQAQRFD